MDIMQMAKDLGKSIQQDPAFKKFLDAQTISEADKTLQDLIGQFNLKRMELNRELASKDKDAQKVSQLDNNLKALYKDITENETMMAFNQAKEEFDVLVNKVNLILSAAMRGEDLDEFDPDAAACTGSCASCAGCH